MNESSKNLKQMLPVLLIIVFVATIVFLGIRMLSQSTGPEQSNPYEYNLDEFKETEQELVGYTEIRKIKIELQNLYGLAVGVGDRIYVSGDKKVLILDRQGRQISAIDLTKPAKCITIDQNGEIYLGMRNHVEVYDSSGTKKATWPDLDDKAVITSLAVKENDVFVADAGNRVVLRFDKSGKLICLIGEKDPGRQIPGLIIPSPYFDLQIDNDGFLWLVNPGRHSLEKYTDDGDLITSWGQTSMAIEGFCGCCNPTHIAILRNGSFVTSEKGLVRVKIYNPVGDFTAVVAGAEHFAEGTVGLDLAVNSLGHILVLDPKAGAVRIFAETDKVSK